MGCTQRKNLKQSNECPKHQVLVDESEILYLAGVLASEIGPGFSPDIAKWAKMWALAPGICLLGTAQPHRS
jgi:hypothetical protein